MTNTIIPASVYRIAAGLTLTGLAALLLCAGQLFYWALDSKPPFALLSYSTTAALPGQTAIIDVHVRRDLTRSCSVNYSRMFFDAEGARTDLTDGIQIMTAEALADLNNRTPNRLLLSVAVPTNAAKGTATIITVLEYICNPLHQLYPIPVLMSLNLEIL